MQICAFCGFTQNRLGARFCSNCASPLNPSAPIACPRCGAQNASGARFCSNCADSLVSTTGVQGLNVSGVLAPNAVLVTRYVIQRQLGKGGMGAVYQASDLRLQGKTWAIKEMIDTQLIDPKERADAISAFEREAQLLATLRHPNLPLVIDFFQENGKQYLVMDFIEGQTLENVMNTTSGFLPERWVLNWTEQLCNVLDYLHTRQPPIIFRDLKPANVMLTPDQHVKLIDFGIVRFFKAGKSKDTALYGTMGFAAPEQLGTGQTDARSDIFSLGVMLHALLTRFDPASAPFHLPPPRSVNPALSPQLEAAIVRATKTAPNDRFQTVRELRDALSTPSKPGAPVSVPSPSFHPSAPPTLQVPSAPPGMVLIPAGEFMMGGTKYEDEKPQHIVYLDAFYIDRYPVTNAEYKKFVDATMQRVPKHWNKGEIPPGKENHPVVNVDWTDAQAYCKWAGKRLPTEAEWEKAARGADGRLYPWGQAYDPKCCNAVEGRTNDTTPVGRYSPLGDSPYGVSDMAGNVWEWCEDWFDDKYYRTSPRYNPKNGVKAGSPYRVNRGGSYANDRDSARTTTRKGSPPDSVNNGRGFRCAKSV